MTKWTYSVYLSAMKREKGVQNICWQKTDLTGFES